MKILVTGSTGLVGNSLTAALKQNSSFHMLTPLRSEVDLTNQQQVQQYISKHQPDLIINLAARVGGIVANSTFPTEFILENALISFNIIQAAFLNKIPHLINMGSSCMYPKDKEVLQENDFLTGLLEPTNQPYAIAKIAAAQLCESISQQYGLHYKTIVPTNLYGPYDNFHPQYSHLLPAIIRKLHEAKQSGTKEVIIWGDGEARREFMYVSDLVNFLVKVIPHTEKLPHRINVGLNEDFSINDYYQIAAEVIGFDGQFTHDLSKPKGMQRKLLDSTLARSFAWEPTVSLQQGIQLTYDYYLQNFGDAG